ncbi:porin [Pelagibaculum spongiae]|uniref:Uncharacterized protein n=1 Tax=Pelagibaculum spongiae TaxID=2080658 RepID=A0A2V1H3X7_9GAMM|nr:porin [Pelagibaculum spongiae]PVZ71485.1 hypothetical protein DC094_00070 [Pelagibaculum spongiae]
MKKKVLPALIASLIASPVFATELPLQLNGFLTVGAAKSDNDAVSYSTSINDKVSFENDTRAGFQITFDASNDLSFVAQFIAEAESLGGEESWDNRADWVYGQFQLTDDVLVRGGRLRMPIFLMSDYLEVGYGLPWIRPPAEVYSQIPWEAYEGVDLLWFSQLGNLDILFQPLVGTVKQDIPIAGLPAKFRVDDAYGMNFSIASEHLTLRAGYVQGDITLEARAFGALNTVIGYEELYWLGEGTPQNSENRIALGLLANGATPSDLVDSSGTTPRPSALLKAALPYQASIEGTGKFLGLGAQYDDGHWLVLGEWTQRKVSNSPQIADTTGWYTTLGYRFGNLMPHITYAKLTTDEKDAPTLIANDQKSITAGIRYELDDAVSLKFEWQRTEASNDSIGRFYDSGYSYQVVTDVQSGNNPADTDNRAVNAKADLISIALDVVF